VIEKRENLQRNSNRRKREREKRGLIRGEIVEIG
jgi:hypothetical protein